MELSRKVRDAIFPPRGNLRRVHFKEDDWLTALVPDDELFGLMREMVLQRVYDMAGPLPTGTVVDAGAHVGLFSLVASRRAERVVSVEPDPINYRVLEINRELNRARNITTLNRALWHEEGSVSFGTTSQTTGGSVTGGGDLEVQTVTLDGLVETYGPIDLLKIDIEGAEFPVLARSSSLDRVRRIVGELHLREPGGEAELVAGLERSGFSVRVVRAADLYGPRQVPRILRNWRRLRGETKMKAGVVAYMLAPVTKPRKPEGWHELPLLVAHR
jgi:FkbM family methyltransferase